VYAVSLTSWTIYSSNALAVLSDCVSLSPRDVDLLLTSKITKPSDPILTLENHKARKSGLDSGVRTAGCWSADKLIVMPAGGQKYYRDDGASLRHKRKIMHNQVKFVRWRPWLTVVLHHATHAIYNWLTIRTLGHGVTEIQTDGEYMFVN
jgi:hypothetical protein